MRTGCYAVVLCGNSPIEIFNLIPTGGAGKFAHIKC